MCYQIYELDLACFFTGLVWQPDLTKIKAQSDLITNIFVMKGRKKLHR